MTDTTNARRALYLALMTDGVTGRGHSPGRSEQATALIEAFRDEVLGKFAQGDAREILGRHRDQVLTEAAAQQRAAAQRLDEYGLAAAQPLLVALADTIDPTVQGMFVPARVRDAAADLLAARTTTAQEG